MKKEYESPILASLYKFLGWLLLIGAAGAILLLMGLAKSGSNTTIPDEFGIYLGAAIVSAILLLGSAQIIDCIGKTAYHAQQQRYDEMLEVLKKWACLEKTDTNSGGFDVV